MFKEAQHVYYLFLKMTGYTAVVNPFSMVCHVLPDFLPLTPYLRYHEEAHFMQIERDGRIRFCAKYLYRNIKYGYRDNPYEVEARLIALNSLLNLPRLTK